MFLLNDYLCWLFGAPTEREEFLGNVDFFPYFEIAPWCLGVKGKVLNYSHEIHEYSAFFPQYQKAGISKSLHADSCMRGRFISHIERLHWFCDLIMGLWKQLEEGGEKQTQGQNDVWKSSQSCQTAGGGRGNTLVEGIRRALEASIFCCPFVLYQSFFISQIVWASTGLRNNDA